MGSVVKYGILILNIESGLNLSQICPGLIQWGLTSCDTSANSSNWSASSSHNINYRVASLGFWEVEYSGKKVGYSGKRQRCESPFRHGPNRKWQPTPAKYNGSGMGQMGLASLLWNLAMAYYRPYTPLKSILPIFFRPRTWTVNQSVVQIKFKVKILYWR